MIDILVCVLNMCSFQAGLRGTGADVTGLVVLLTCPLGPDPLASRGLAAVLAQAGTVEHILTKLRVLTRAHASVHAQRTGTNISRQLQTRRGPVT